MPSQLFDSLLRIVIAAPIAYATLIAMLRFSGKRTLSQFNIFDFVVTVALGSMLATVILSEDLPLPVGIFGLALLIALQFVVAWLACRVKGVEAVIKAQPSVLLRDGKFLHAAMLRQRVSEEEVRSAIRNSGVGDVSRIAAVVLETDGGFSVIPADRAGNGSALPSG